MSLVSNGMSKPAVSMALQIRSTVSTTGMLVKSDVTSREAISLLLRLISLIWSTKVKESGRVCLQTWFRIGVSIVPLSGFRITILVSFISVWRAWIWMGDRWF